MKTVSLKRVADLIAGGTPSVNDPKYWTEDAGAGIPWVTISDMTRSDPVRETARHVSREGIAARRLSIGEPGTVLFAMYASVGALDTLGIRAAWNQAILGIRPKSSAANDRFIRYWLQSLRPRLGELFRSNTQDNLNAEQVGGLPFPVLPVPEQRAIADYLDAETVRIDALIAKKERLATLLADRMSGYVEDAIRSMVHTWGEAPLRYQIKDVTVGIVVTPAAWYVDDGRGIPALRGINVHRGRILPNEMQHISYEGHVLHRKSELQTGDVVVVRTGEAGTAAVVPSALDGANCIDLIVIKPGNLDPNLLGFVLNSDWTQKHIDKYSVGTIQSHFNVSAMESLPVPTAPFAEQRQVMERLEALRSRSDSTGQRLDNQIALLRERRQALITAAVSGRLDIPKNTRRASE
jgi:type I restriction enzyme S subunit